MASQKNNIYPKSSPYYNSQIVNNNYLDVLQPGVPIPKLPLLSIIPLRLFSVFF